MKASEEITLFETLSNYYGLTLDIDPKVLDHYLKMSRLELSQELKDYCEYVLVCEVDDLIKDLEMYQSSISILENVTDAEFKQFKQEYDLTSAKNAEF